MNLKQSPTALLLLLSIVLGASFYSRPIGAALIQVPADFTTIQAALDAANDGDEIVISPGTYSENLIFSGPNLTLRSTAPQNASVRAATILDGMALGSVVTFAGTEGTTTTLQGFTIQNGKAAMGGGINGSGALAIIQFNTIQNNTSTSSGGGLYLCQGTIRRNEIRGNKANGGAGLEACGGPIEENAIYDNTALSGGGLRNCQGTILNNRIFSNSAYYYTYCGYVTIGGGGLYNCHGLICGNIISNNRAFGDHPGCCGSDFIVVTGGGLQNCDGTLENNVIFGNTAVSTAPNFCGNTINVHGGGLSGCTGVIRNCIIWGNTAATFPQISYSSAPTYCDIQGSAGTGTGNLDVDPGFLNSGSGDFHLQLASPLVDTGDPAPALNDACLPPGLTTARNDMGAYGGRHNCGDIPVMPPPTPTPSPSPTSTPSATPSRTPTMTPTASPSATPTRTPTPTASPSRTPSPSPSRTATPTRTASPSPSRTATPSASPSPSPSRTPTPTSSPTASASPSKTASPSPSRTPSPTASATASPTGTPTRTATPVVSASPTAVQTPSATSSPSPTPRNDSQLLGYNIPPQIPTSHQVPIDITMRNIGDTVWTANDGYSLSVVSDSCSLFGSSFLPINPGASVQPGEPYTFMAVLTGPALIQNCQLEFSMNRSGEGNFGQSSQVPIGIVSAVNDAVFVSHTIPPRIRSGTGFGVGITVKNTGNTTWTADQLFALAVTEDGCSLFGSSRMELAPEVAIGPNQPYQFIAQINTPAQAGLCSVRLRPVEGSTNFFGEELVLPIEVFIPANGAQDWSAYE